MTKTVPTRERLILAAMDLFHRRGYEATGLKDILRRAKANSGSLYDCFKCKEELLLAVLEKYNALLHPTVNQAEFSKADDPNERCVADGHG